MSTVLTIKDIIDEDFTNYKKPSMFIATRRCSFKCQRDDCKVHCQNLKIVKQPDIEMPITKIIDRYLNNKITSAIVFGGLEPFDQFYEIIPFISEFRTKCLDDIVIYTGYTEDEIKHFKHNKKSFLDVLLRVNRPIYDSNYKPSVIVKYGRFKSSGDKRYDEILGVELASSNQYAKLYK